MFDLVLYRLKRPYHFFRTGILEGVPAQLKYSKALKDLTVVGITGTDGKTTTSTLLYAMLTHAGYKTGLISTVGGYVGNKMLDTGLHVTSPGPRALYRLLSMMKKAGCTHVVLEATSHGLYQHRFWGVRPKIAGVTNITHEHLDYHRTWQEYARAKMLLLRQAESVYFNVDDASRTFLQQQRWSKKQRIHRYGHETSLPKVVQSAITARFKESYNRANAMLAFLIAQELGVTAQWAASAITEFEGIPGRMEVVATTPVKVIVDFAHTPNGLESALTAARSNLSGSAKLIAVFGCAGLRDIQKRPLMGEVGARLADLAVFTAEDPRTEDVWAIIRQMKAGVIQNHNHIISIPDRRKAIEYAIKTLARRGDTVIICGKGHERSMCFGTEETPWHDPTVVSEILKA